MTSSKATPEHQQCHHGLSRRSSRSVEEHVRHCRTAPRHKYLVKLIQRGIARDHQDHHQRPAEPELAVPSPESPQQEQAENEILGEVTALTYDVMNRKKCFRCRVGQQPAQKGDNKSGGVFGRKCAGRKCRNQDGPEERRPPIPEPSHSIATAPGTRARIDLLDGVLYSSR